MAIIHRQATVTPSKLEILGRWVPTQLWCAYKDPSAFESVGAYRFDDPAGEVGIETLLLRTSDDAILQVPVTYRGSPLAGAEKSLIATTEHSVLGTRWVYDACGDHVYVKALATTILFGGAQAELEVVTNAGKEHFVSPTRVSGTGAGDTPLPTFGTTTFSSDGTETVVRSNDLELVILRTIDVNAQAQHLSLVGTWPGHDDPALLAFARKL